MESFWFNVDLLPLNIELHVQPYKTVRFFVTPKPADVDEHLKPSTRPYHQEWWLVHLFYIIRGVEVIPCGGCTDTPTRCLRRSAGEFEPEPMLWYHVRFYITPKPTDFGEHLKPNTRPNHQEWRLVHLFYIPIGAVVIPCGGTRYSNRRDIECAW